MLITYILVIVIVWPIYDVDVIVILSFVIIIIFAVKNFIKRLKSPVDDTKEVLKIAKSCGQEYFHRRHGQFQVRQNYKCPKNRHRHLG